MKFYEFYQNNSGGHYQKNMPHKIYIQAPNAEVANSLAEAEGAYFNGVSDGIDCDCCGDRWSKADEFYGVFEENQLPRNDKYVKIVYTTGIFKELM